MSGFCPYLFLSVNFHSQADSLQEVAKWSPPVLSLYSTIYLGERKFHLTNYFVQIPRIVSPLVYLGYKLFSKAVTLNRRPIVQIWVMWQKQGLGQTCPIIWIENKGGEVTPKNLYAIGERRTHSWQAEITYSPHFLKNGTSPRKVHLSSHKYGWY